MNVALLESLLNEHEGEALDFKGQEYPFEGATDEQKCELLKDILAMANAWRRIDAYILVGVREVQVGRSNVVGVSSHIADASLQQFVNHKTQRPVAFSYEPYQFEGKQLGILHVPLQERPFYLNKGYGKLMPNTVYIRRGSATGVATLDEIAKMGIARQEDLNSHTELQALLEELEFFQTESSRVRPIETRVRFGSDQYRRLFDKGIIVRLDVSLKKALRDAYSEIQTIDEIINVAWNSGRGCNIWAENVNEATARISIAKMKATTAIHILKNHLAQ